MILNKNMEAMLHSPDGNTEFFNIFSGVLQGDTLASYLFIVCLDCVFRMLINLIKENGFAQKKF